MNTATRHQICTRCIMDTSDPDITFDADGVCSHCRDYDRVMRGYVFPDDLGRQKLLDAVSRMRTAGRGRRYDCIIGLSGGVDSSYVAWMVRDLGLRPLAVHLDNGWNTEAAVRNIENIVNKLGIDLYTEVLDWEEFRSLQVAFLRASTPDCEIPTDHAITATLFRVALREKIKFIVSGGNFATELMVPLSWSDGHTDWKYIRTINKRFGDKPLRSFPHYNFFDKTYYFRRIRGIELVSPLNWIRYDKFATIELLREKQDWQLYGGKHQESIYTRFYQGYILPRKFGADKRRPHLSCLINARSITRDDALRQIQKPPLDDDLVDQDREFVIKKLGLSEAEFEEIMDSPVRRFWDFPSDTANPPAYHRIVQTVLVSTVASRSKLRGAARKTLALVRGAGR